MDNSGEQEFFILLLRIFIWLVRKAYGRDIFQTGEIKVMAQFVVKDNNPDVGVRVTVGEVKDAEGRVITDPSGLSIEIAAQNDNPDDPSVSVTDNGDGTGVVSFGGPGQGSTNYQVKGAGGEVLGVGSDSFLVTTGDPASVSGVTAAFDGLTPVDVTPATPGVTPNP